MEKQSINYKLTSLVLTGAALLSSCASKFNTDQELIAAENISVVTDYNSVIAETGTNPRCTIPAGSPVKIGEFSSIPISSSERQSIVELISKDSNCTGWTPNISSLNDELIEK